MIEKIQPGIYEHFKGGLYEVIDEAERSDIDGEPISVAYYPLYEVPEPRRLQLRTIENFFEEVAGLDGKPVPRFRYLDPQPEQ